MLSQFYCSLSDGSMLILQALICILKRTDIHSSVWVYIAWFFDGVHSILAVVLLLCAFAVLLVGLYVLCQEMKCFSKAFVWISLIGGWRHRLPKSWSLRVKQQEKVSYCWCLTVIATQVCFNLSYNVLFVAVSVPGEDDSVECWKNNL